MDILTFLGCLLLVDATVSLIVFGFLYFFRRDLLRTLRTQLRSFLNIEDIELKVEETYEELKPAMREAMDDVFEEDYQ